MTGATVGSPSGASPGRVAGCWKAAAHICTTGHQDCQFIHQASQHIAEQALGAPFHAARHATEGGCEIYLSSPGYSDLDAASGPSAIVSLSLAVRDRAAEHRAKLLGHSQLRSPWLSCEHQGLLSHTQTTGMKNEKEKTKGSVGEGGGGDFASRKRK